MIRTSFKQNLVNKEVTMRTEHEDDT